MESGNHLGICWSKNKATVVCLASPGRERKVLDCFSVSVDGEEQGQQALADRIVQACRQRKVKFTSSAVALDCASFMQHTVHSEFRDPKRIAATIRFDTEEALATDISEIAVSFRVTSGAEEGSNLDVFTVQRSVLSDILLSLQSNGIDPVAVDPDVCCLARYLGEYAKTQDTPEQSTLYAMLSGSHGYLVAVSGAGQASVLRTFLIGSAQDRTGLLIRETLVTTALADAAHPVGRLCVFDATGGLRTESLQEGTGLKVSTCDPAGLAGAKPGDGGEGVNAVDLALACGAALAPAEKADSVNLRHDHMPYLGKKRRQQNAVRLLSISVTMLLLAVGVCFHSQLIRVSKQRENLRDKLEVDYLAVMPGAMPTPMKKASDDLEKALRHLRAEKTGAGANQGSVSAMLTLVLQSLNACARQTDLNVGSITITSTNIVIVADTSSRQNTQGAIKTMREMMKKAGITGGSESIGGTGERDAFTITAELAKATKGA
ncbi:MAG: hypothetical protein NTZ17_19605 [Phycisphaerae bacterium]|nr:hypothetical protein [Phycisphaerae bacterium]